jgi:hypothetical protein
MTLEDFEQYRGKSVTFSVQDIYLPDPTAVLAELHGNDTLTGTVIDLSDDARDERTAFLVVEVEHIQGPCIVAIERDRLRSLVDGGES